MFAGPTQLDNWQPIWKGNAIQCRIASIRKIYGGQQSDGDGGGQKTGDNTNNAKSIEKTGKGGKPAKNTEKILVIFEQVCVNKGD